MAHGASQLKTSKRITAVQFAESAEGSRVTVTSDSALDDYEAFRRGDRFYVKIPFAEFSAAQPNFQGAGFEDVQVQKTGDSVIISFKLLPGASARVSEGSNRLEVLFFSPIRLATSSEANAVRSRRSSSRTRASSSRSKPGSGIDVAGPMPPDSPTSYQPDSARSRQSDDATIAAARSRSNNRPESTQTVVTPADGAIQNNTPIPTPTPAAAGSEYSTAYPPASTSFTPARTDLAKPSPNVTKGRFDLTGRAQAVRQWVMANKPASLIGGLGFLAVLSVAILVLYRRRRGVRKALKPPPVQPKYSEDVQLEDLLVQRSSSKVSPGPYVDEDAYESWGETKQTQDGFLTDLRTEQESGLGYEHAQSNQVDATVAEPWEFVRESSRPRPYQGRMQEEREVFEL
jgi:hypothetical protein